MKSRILFALWLFLLGPALHAQNLTWLRKDSLRSIVNGVPSSEIYSLGTDAQENIYAAISNDVSSLISDSNGSIPVTNGTRGKVVVKYSPGGEVLWIRQFPFATTSVPEISVNKNGDIIFTSGVDPWTDVVFEGVSVPNETGANRVFWVKLDANGSVITWDVINLFRDEVEITSFYGAAIMEDGRFWIATTKLEENNGIEYRGTLELYGNSNVPLKSIVVNEGVFRNDIEFGDLQVVNDQLYFLVRGSGLFGKTFSSFLAAANPYQYLVRINPSDEVEEVLSVTKGDDSFINAIVHEDGTLSIIGRSLDGTFETTVGDFLVPINQRFLANIGNGNLNAVIPVPEFIVRFKPYTSDDDRMIIIGWMSDDSGPTDIADGRGNTFTIPTPANNVSSSFIAIYNKRGVLSFFDDFKVLSDPGRIFVYDAIANDNCDALYLAGMSHQAIDFDLNDSNQVVTDAASNWNSYFLAKYNNEKPRIATPDSVEVCPGDSLRFELTIFDEAADQANLRFTSDDPGFDPNALLIEGTGITRTVQVPATAIESDLLLNVRVTDVCGDFTEKEILITTVELPPPPRLSTKDEYLLCPGDTLRLWSDATGEQIWSDGNTRDTLEITTAGTFWSFQVNELGCVSANSDSLTVILADLPVVPVISTSGPLEFCEGDSVVLTASIDEGIRWSNGVTSRSLVVRESGSFSIRQVSEFCGVGDASAEVIVRVKPIPAQPLITVSGNTRFCEGGEVTLSSSSPTGNLWSTGETSQQIVVDRSGAYTVRVITDDCEGPLSDSVTVLVDEDFELTLVSDTSVCDIFNEIELIPSATLPDLDYLWSDGSTLPTLIVSEEGQYWLEVNNGTCQRRVLVSVREECFPRLFMPNAFSPNGDQENDSYGPIASRVQNFHMQIYNRWGKLLFASSAIHDTWDGTYEGVAQPVGQYTYRIVYTGFVGEEETTFVETGAFRLLR